jgi:hypothetical protein
MFAPRIKPLSPCNRRGYTGGIDENSEARVVSPEGLGNRRRIAEDGGTTWERLMATTADWATPYARQGDADLTTFEKLQPIELPPCHKLQFLQMACEKLVKAHLCGSGTSPGTLQQSHAYIAGTLP